MAFILTFLIGYLPLFTCQLTFHYQSNNGLDSHLRNLISTYSSLSKLLVIGKSTKNKNLIVVEITSNPSDFGNLKPYVKLIGNVHGNKPGGRQILINFIEYLLENYGKDDKITNMIDTTRISILCSLNPDGYNKQKAIIKFLEDNKQIDATDKSKHGRLNEKDVDLDVDFDWVNDKSIKDSSETNAMIEWMKSYPFILSASFYSGELVVSYPYHETYKKDSNDKWWVREEKKTPDDALFRHLAKSYSLAHPTMATVGTNDTCLDSSYGLFEDGIINGAKFEPYPGTMADYNYRRLNCFEIYVYLGCEKWVHKSSLKSHWEENKKSLLAFVDAVHIGVKGMILRNDNDSTPIPNAKITFLENEGEIRSWKTGEYWRMLLPGAYIMSVSARDHRTQTLTFRVEKGQVLVKNVTLIYHPLVSGDGRACGNICLITFYLAVFLAITQSFH